MATKAPGWLYVHSERPRLADRAGWLVGGLAGVPGVGIGASDSLEHAAVHNPTPPFRRSM